MDQKRPSWYSPNRRIKLITLTGIFILGSILIGCSNYPNNSSGQDQNNSLLEVLDVILESNDDFYSPDGVVDVDDLVTHLLVEGFSLEEINENLNAILEQLPVNEKTASDMPSLSKAYSDFNEPMDEESDLGGNDPSESDVGSDMCPVCPIESVRVLKDSGSGYWTEQQRALSGDNFKDNLYERPFSSGEMVYRPDLDIYTVEFAYDDDFFFYTINLHGIDEQTGELEGIYGIEFDRSLTGRGDLLVLVESLTKDWSVNEAIVLENKNDETGDSESNTADEGSKKSDYEKDVFFDEESIVCARLSPDFEDSIQVSISRLLLNNPEQFLWGAWAFDKFEMFDKQDSMEASEAGSPIIDSEDYPITGLYNIDNTCRLPYGFDQIGASIPRLCFTRPQEKKPDKKDDGGCTQYCVTKCPSNPNNCCNWGCK